MGSKPFQFKQFQVDQDEATHKVGTDGVLLGAWVNVRKDDCHIADIGTGTGVIALMLAQRAGATAHIDAVEIEAGDVRQARKNFAQSPWPQKVTIHHTAIQDFNPERQYDLIVANPPYFVNSLRPPDSKRSLARHALSLTFDDLLRSMARLLAKTGRCAVILPYTEGLQFVRLARAFGLFPIRRTWFRSRPRKPVERLLLELAFEGTCADDTEIVLYDAHGDWSMAYRELTAAFYLKV